MKTRNISSSALCALFLLLGDSIYAQTPVPTEAVTGFGDSSVYWNAESGYTLGWEFSVNSPISVTALGLLNDSGWSSDHQVAIWDASGEMLAYADVPAFPSGPPPSPGWSWGDDCYYTSLVMPLNLVPGEDYIIGADYPPNNSTGQTDGFEGPTVSGSASQVNLISAALTGDVDYPFMVEPTPVSPANGEVYLGPNFVFEPTAVPVPVPEPSTLGLFGTGAMMLLGWRNRRKA
jgi:hypothetical protein